MPVYNGDVWSTLFSANWAVTESTALNLTYQYERANNDDEDPELIAAGTMPRGIAYDRQVIGLGVRHQFNKKLTGFVNYTYYQNRDDQWNEDGSYTANAVVTGLTLTF